MKEEKDNLSLRKKILIVGFSFFILVLIIASFFGEKGLVETYYAEKKREALLQQIKQLEQEKERLLREIEALEKDPRSIEVKAREKLWLVKPGEIVILKK